MQTPVPRRPLVCTAATLAALATAAAVHAGDTLTLYVDDDAAPGGDGLSWEAPMRDLQHALAMARQAEVTNAMLQRIDILVAQGTYVPRRSPDDPFSDSFIMAFDFSTGSVHAASLQGGFAGVTAANPGARDPQAFPTILSGDINGDDEPDFNNYEDNAGTIVSAQGTTSTMVHLFDGLTIRGGNGGGLGMVMCQAIVRNCVIEENRAGGIGVLGSGGLWLESSIVRRNAAERGGGISCGAVFDCFLSITDSVVRDNEATWGGGVYVRPSPDRFVSIERSDLLDNNAVFGGGMFLDAPGWGQTNSVIEQSRIVGNQASSAGGGIYVHAALMCHSTLITNNSAADFGGGLYAAFDSAPRLFCSTVASNVARRGSGLMFDEVAEPIVVAGSIVWGNLSRGGGGEVVLRSIPPAATPALTHSIMPAVDGIESPLPNLEGSLDLDPQFVSPDGPDGHSDRWADNNYSLQPTSPAIDRGVDPFKRSGDLLGNPRAVDVPSVPNLADPAWPVDMGAIEYVPCPCDADNDQAITAFDLLLYLDWWFPGEALAERTGDQPPHIDAFDLLAFLDCWFAASAGGPCP